MSWSDLNQRIAQLRRLPNAVEALSSLFDQTRDGHVAFALGEALEASGDTETACRWYHTAAERYPLPDFKSRAKQAADRLRSFVPAPSTTLGPAPPQYFAKGTVGVLTVGADPAGPVYRGQFVCPQCGYRGAWLIIRNSAAVSDRQPAFLIVGDDPRAEKIGHLFVGAPDRPTIYYGEVYHCAQPTRVYALFNRALRAPSDPLLTLVAGKKPL